jgi:hypothetical protein
MVSSRADLRKHLHEFKQEAFRLEMLDKYEVASSNERVSRFLGGDPLPPHSATDWLDLVANATQGGKLMQRVHILPGKLTPYLRYEIEWGYCYSASVGENIYVVQSDKVLPSLLNPDTRDFWLFDNKVAIVLHYDEGGRLVDIAEEIDAARIQEHVRTKEALLQIATPLRSYLAAIRNA